MKLDQSVRRKNTGFYNPHEFEQVSIYIYILSMCCLFDLHWVIEAALHSGMEIVVR